MPATRYALDVKLDLLLKDQSPVRKCDGSLEWDYEPAFRLIWVDPLHARHVVSVPPAPLPLGAKVQTVCGREVLTTRISLVAAGPYSEPTCAACQTELCRRPEVPPVRSVTDRIGFVYRIIRSVRR